MKDIDFNFGSGVIEYSDPEENKRTSYKPYSNNKHIEYWHTDFDSIWKTLLSDEPCALKYGMLPKDYITYELVLKQIIRKRMCFRFCNKKIKKNI